MVKEKNLIIQILIADLILMSVTVCITYWGAIFINPVWMNGFNNLPNLIALYDTCLLACNGVYPSILHHRTVRIEAIIQRVLGVGVLLLLFVSIITVLIEANTHFPRTYTFATVGLFTILSIFERLFINKLLKSTRRKKKNATNVILIGKEKSIAELADVLSIPHYGYNVMGVFYDGENDNQSLNSLYLGEINDIYSYLATHSEVNEIYGYFPREEQDRMAMLGKYCDNHLVRFYYVPSIDIFRNNATMEYVEGIPVIARREEPLSQPKNKIIKRAFDLIVSSLFLVLVFPWIYIIVGLMIKLKSPGPIFFIQERTGIDGKVFNCFKFRTMKVNDQADTMQATENDPRKYPFGDFMRHTNIDELPQFINVFLGDMSIVGPRPHMLRHTEEYSSLINKFMVRHLAKPGITGLAQVSGFRGETRYIDQMEGRVKKDIEYIENWTLLLDLKIIWKTVTNMLGKEENAY